MNSFSRIPSVLLAMAFSRTCDPVVEGCFVLVIDIERSDFVFFEDLPGG